MKGSTRAEHQASGGEPSAFYVTGGQQRTFVETDEWRQYGKAVIARVDVEGGTAHPCVEYESPPDVCPEEEPSITFKAGTLWDDKLYVCTSTEVLVYDVPSFTLAGYVSLPCFNDLHHVHPTPQGTLLVANTGLDMVVEVSEAGDKVREWNVLGGDPWTRFSPDVDYRKVPTTKPHHSHPNHVFMLDDEVWVTRFEQRDAVCLNDGDLPRMPVDVQRPHDGTPHHGYVYFTTVDGHIVVVNEETRKPEEVVNLNPQNGQETPLGWCRGLKVVDRTKVWVGFSRFRPTKFLENVNWIKNGFRRRKPTHIALYDLVRRERIQEIALESAGLHTVFSILDAPKQQATAESRSGRAHR